MQGLSESLPRINYFLHENKTANLLQDLNDGKLDLLILPLLEGMDKFDHYHLFNEPLLLALPHDHPLNEQKSLQLKDLQGQRVLTLEDGHCLRDQTLGYCFSAGADEDPRFQASSLETLRHMVAAGLGITLIPKLATANTQPSTMIKYRSFSKPEPSREIVILIRQNYPKIQCIQRIVSILRESTKAFNQP
jgi:LysR family hydrogen peroxide-inducible transcriptional activator